LRLTALATDLPALAGAATAKQAAQTKPTSAVATLPLIATPLSDPTRPSVTLPKA
jgi:hypothetical protein